MAATTGTPGKGSAPVRRGSTFSDRQIFSSVKDGMAIEVALPSPEGTETVTGWVFGVDDFHWGLVTPAYEKYLVHKATPYVRITNINIPTASGSEVRALVEPFRAYVMREHFNQQTASN